MFSEQVEEVKKVFIPHNERDKEKLMALRPKRRIIEMYKSQPTDDVYPMKYYVAKNYPFAEAVECHRETHHPDMYNVPSAKLHVTLEINMHAEKKNKFLDNFSRVAVMPHVFDHGQERQILAFTKEEELQQAARDAGAALVGGVELVKEIQNGKISLQDFHFVVGHPNILPELVSLRGLMKKKFPNPKSGTLDGDIRAAVQRFVHGVSYTAVKDEYEKDFGVIETEIGTLDMETAHLEANFASLLRDVHLVKPKNRGDIFIRCLLWSPPSGEKLKVDHRLYVQVKEDNAKEEHVEDEDGEEMEVVEAKG